MIEVRKATIEDVSSIVAIHKQSFPNFFLTTLGDGFLRLYYSCMCKCEEAVTLCASDDGKVAGFATSAYVSYGFNKNLIKKNLFQFGLMAVKLLFTKPDAIIRLIKNIDKESSDKSFLDNGEYAELYSIAVSPKCQGKGVGKMLLAETEKDVSNHNKAISLTTDYFNNDKAIGFYHSLGYTNYYEFITYPNRRMWRMIKELK